METRDRPVAPAGQAKGRAAEDLWNFGEEKTCAARFIRHVSTVFIYRIIRHVSTVFIYQMEWIRKLNSRMTFLWLQNLLIFYLWSDASVALTRTWWCLAWPRGAASVPSSQALSWHKRLSLAGWHWGFRFETRWDRPTPQGLEHADHCEYSCLQSGGCWAEIVSHYQCLVFWS